MYCSACGNQLTQGLSFCNRCGSSLKERQDSKSSINAFLTAITIIGVSGLGIMLGGALALKDAANLDNVLVAFFMLFTLTIVTTTEVLLIRQLSRFINDPKQTFLPPQYHREELPPAQEREFVEPLRSVTENTTRTLEHVRNEPGRRS